MIDSVGDILIPIMCSIVSLDFLYIGFHGLIERKPFLVNGKLFMGPMFVIFICVILYHISMYFSNGFDSVMNTVFVVLFGLVLVMYWKSMRGYFMVGIKDESFRTALHHALGKLGLGFEESITRIKLSEINAELNVSIQSGFGTGLISIKPAKQNKVLSRIKTEMARYYQSNEVQVNLLPSIFHLLVGVLFLIMDLEIIKLLLF